MNNKSQYKLECCLKGLDRYPIGSLFFLTVTAPRQFSGDLKLHQKMTSLTSNLFGRRQIKYVKVVELHKDGRLHWHFILVLPWDAGEEVRDIDAVCTKAEQTVIEKAHYSGALLELSKDMGTKMKNYGAGRFNMTPVKDLKALRFYLTKSLSGNDSKLPKGVRVWSVSKDLKVVRGDFSFHSKRAQQYRLSMRLVSFSLGCVEREEMKDRYGPRWWYHLIRPEIENVSEMIAYDQKMDMIHYLVEGRRINPAGTTNKMVVELMKKAYPKAEKRGGGA